MEKLTQRKNSYTIREAYKDEYSIIGKLKVDVYSKLEGFPSIDEQPNYYDSLLHIEKFAELPKVKLLIAVSENVDIMGSVVYFGDMKYYGSGGTATEQKNAAGFRLLAVNCNYRGLGIGKALTLKCIDIAKSEQKEQLIIHSTEAMKIAWNMYDKLGFKRSKDLDFLQEELPVFGFRLQLIPTHSQH